MRNFYSKILVLSLLLQSLVLPMKVISAQDVDVKTQEVVGYVLSTNQEASSFDLEFTTDDPAQQKQVSTFFVTDITTIDIAMAQGTLADLKPGLRVLVEFASMPDGTNVVESVWVKK